MVRGVWKEDGGDIYMSRTLLDTISQKPVYRIDLEEAWGRLYTIFCTYFPTSTQGKKSRGGGRKKIAMLMILRSWIGWMDGTLCIEYSLQMLGVPAKREEAENIDQMNW